MSITDLIDQILINRIEVFQSKKAIDIMANQLYGRITSQDYIKCSERGAVWNSRLMQMIATERGLRTDSVKSLLYPTQLFNDSIRAIKEIDTRLMSAATLRSRDNLQQQQEIQALLEIGQVYVSDRLSLIASFRDSQPYLKGTAQDVLHKTYLNKLVYEYNRLSSLGNQLYKAIGPALKVPRYGKIALEKAIEEADAIDYCDQWRTDKVVLSAGDTLEAGESAEEFNRLILSTNGLRNDPELIGIETVVNREDN